MADNTSTAATTAAATTTAASTTAATTAATAATTAATTTASKAWFDGLYGADGKINKDVWEKAPEPLKAHKDFFAKYDTVDGLLGGAANANKLAVAKAMRPLPENATPEQIAERREHLALINNVPKEPTGYGIQKPADLPAENWSQPLADEFAKVALEECLSPSSAKRILALQETAVKQQIAAAKQAEAAYKVQQDRNFEAAAHQQGLAPDAANTLAIRGAVTLGIKPNDPILEDAAFRLAMVRFTKLVSEDKLVTGDMAEPGKMSYREQARDIMGNDQNPLHKAWADPGDPGHDDAKAKVSELYRLHGEATRRRG